MGVKFSCTSIATREFNAMLGFASVFVLLFAVFTSSWIVYSGTTHYLVNRYYVARTLHLHKLSNIALITPQRNSLGVMHPFSDETDPNKPFTTPAYFVDTGTRPKSILTEMRSVQKKCTQTPKTKLKITILVPCCCQQLCQEPFGVF